MSNWDITLPYQWYIHDIFLLRTVEKFVDFCLDKCCEGPCCLDDTCCPMVTTCHNDLSDDVGPSYCCELYTESSCDNGGCMPFDAHCCGAGTYVNQSNRLCLHFLPESLLAINLLIHLMKSFSANGTIIALLLAV